MILLEALGDFHDTAPISGVVGGIAGGDDGTNDAVVETLTGHCRWQAVR